MIKVAINGFGRIGKNQPSSSGRSHRLFGIRKYIHRNLHHFGALPLPCFLLILSKIYKIYNSPYHKSCFFAKFSAIFCSK